MTYRQSVWGLSNGIIVLSVAGFFWLTLGLGLGLRPVASAAGFASLFPILALLNPLLFLALMVAAFRLRRKATGFRLAEVRDGDEETQPETRRIVRGFRWVGLIETVAIALVGFLCFYFQRPDLAWPWIGLVLGIHLVPLGWIFGLRTYYTTGLTSSGVALVAIAALEGPQQTLFLGYGMGVIAWLSATYLVWNAQQIVHHLTGRGTTGIQAAQQAAAPVGRDGP